MKKDFFDTLFELMKTHKDMCVIFIDLGYPRYEEFKKEYSDRVINTGASEQTALDIAVGLSYEGKIPVVYTITPFYLRAFETIRTYINHEKLPIILVGAGRNDDYSKHDGFSHDATDIRKILGTQENIDQYYPVDSETMKNHLDMILKNKRPSFLSLTR